MFYLLMHIFSTFMNCSVRLVLFENVTFPLQFVYVLCIRSNAQLLWANTHSHKLVRNSSMDSGRVCEGDTEKYIHCEMRELIGMWTQLNVPLLIEWNNKMNKQFKLTAWARAQREIRTHTRLASEAKTSKEEKCCGSAKITTKHRIRKKKLSIFSKFLLCVCECVWLNKIRCHVHSFTTSKLSSFRVVA